MENEKPVQGWLRDVLFVCVFVSFFAPVLTVLCVMFYALMSGSVFKGLVYVLFVLLSLVVIRFPLYAFVIRPSSGQSVLGGACGDWISRFGVSRDMWCSTFVLCFSASWLLVPMFVTSPSVVNFELLGFFVAYMLLDIATKLQLECASAQSTHTWINLVFNSLLPGALTGVGISYGLFATSGSRYLMVNDVSSSGETCSMPSQQQFKCAVYKNGELVSSVLPPPQQ